MKAVDMKRRTILKTTGAGIIVVSSGGIISPASADPLTIGAIIIASIGAAITAIGSWFSSEKTSEINQRLAAAQYQHDWRIRVLGEKPVTMDFAMNAYRNELLTLGLANNVDGFGTDFAIKDGLAYVDRRGFSGTMNAKEAILSGNVFQKFETMPAPLEPMANNNLSKGESNRIRDALGQSMNTDDISLISSRRYSLQSRPKQSEANVEMVAYIDKKLPKVNGKQQVKYTYTI